jgi:hypothetical protein
MSIVDYVVCNKTISFAKTKLSSEDLKAKLEERNFNN